MSVTEVATAVSPARRLARVPRSGIRATIEQPFADVVDLATGDPDLPTPAHVRAAAALAAERGDTHYTHGRGVLELREAFAKKLECENAIPGADPADEIVVSAGGLNGLAASFQALLDPNDEVVIPDPGFANYAAQVLLAGGRPVAAPLDEAAGWTYDLGRLTEMVTPRTRALVVNSPSNPTGAVYDRTELERLVAFAEMHDLVIVSDEAYEHLVYVGAHHSVASIGRARERTVSVFSCSKSYAMTGWRVGFVVAPAPVSAELAKVQEHTIGCPSSISQAAAYAALTGPHEPFEQMWSEFRRRRDLVVEAFAGCSQAQMVEPAGALYAFPRIDGCEKPAQWLLDVAGVQVVPGSAFGLRGSAHVRLSFAGDRARLAEGLERLREALR